MDRRKLLVSGAALGAGIGTIGAMGAFSYSPLRVKVLPQVERKGESFGMCKSVKIVNISETSWFDNGIFINSVSPPACAPSDTLVRFALMATHTNEQVERGVQVLKKIFMDLGIIK